MYTENLDVWFLRYASRQTDKQTHKQTDKHTDRHINHNTVDLYQELSNNATN